MHWLALTSNAGVARVLQTLGEIIGRGGFGVVYHALDMRTGAAVAVKRVTLVKVASEDLAQIEVRTQRGA